MTEQEYEYLRRRLAVDRRPVTAPFLSRRWLVDGRRASEVMQQFYETVKNTAAFQGLTVQYSVCGTERRPDSGQRHADVLVRVVDGKDLDTVLQQQYSSVARAQVFSMQLHGHGPLANVVQMCQSTGWESSSDNMARCGLYQTSTAAAAPATAPRRDEEQAGHPGAAPEQPKKEQAGHPRAAPEQPKKEQAGHPRAAPEQPKKEQEPKRPVYVSRKAATTPSLEPKKAVYTSRKGAKRDVPAAAAAPVSSKRAKTASDADRRKRELERAELEKMMNDGFSGDDGDDGDDFAGGVVVSGDADPVQEAATEYQYDDIDLAESNGDVQKDDDVVLGGAPEAATQLAASKRTEGDVGAKEEKPELEAAVEAKEDKPEVETYVDADGYVVRKINRKPAKPHSDTPKRSFTIDPKPAERPAGQAPKKQSNLMSFFKKK